MRRLTVLVSAVLLLALVAGCSDTDGDGDVEADPLAAAQQRVSRAEEAVADAQAAFDKASRTFCRDSEDYFRAVDRYGGVLTEAGATVGAVKTAGADLADPKSTVASSADDAQAAHADLTKAEADLAEAEAALAEIESGTSVTDRKDTTTTSEPLVPPASVDRVEQAQADLDAAFEGITDETPLSEASEQVNAAAVALQVAWLRVFADAGCFTDSQHEKAVSALTDYTVALQSSLAAAGYYDGKVDGVYGPGTVAAVEKLQKDHDLPVTGFVDRATAAALEEVNLAAGGEAAAQAVAHTAALQSLLTVAGYWSGPIDGEWSDALTNALQSLQRDLGIPATGEIDAATLAAIEQAISTAQDAGKDTPTTTPSPSTEKAPETTTTTA